MLAVVLTPAAQAASDRSERDFAGDAFNVIPPGQSGQLFLPPPSATNQIPLYDGLTPKFDDVTAADLPTFFKPNVFGLAGESPASVQNPPGRPGLRIERDSYGVPHVYGETRDDVMYGAGWVAIEDRAFVMELLRGPGRVAAVDAPGIDPFALATSLRGFVPSAATEQFLASQEDLLRAQGPAGERVLQDVESYVQGINAASANFGALGAPWTNNDVLAAAALIGSVLGRGGGDETRRSQLLSALQQRLGEEPGRRLWDDLRQLDDPEASVTIDHPFHYNRASPTRKGNAVIDDGSLDAAANRAVAAASTQTRLASNALLVSAKRSTNGHPLLVAGPQVGYSFPPFLMEMDLHGGGIDARGAVFPGSGPYVLLGRGQDFAWSATSSGSDVVDHYVEELCGDDTHYVFNGRCREMTTFNAGTLLPAGVNPAQEVVFKRTVHGPVIGYATVGGKRVAISQKRSTRGREGLNAIGFSELNANVANSAQSFLDVASKIEFSFNWFYADHEQVAMFSSGRLPNRHPHVDPGLPAIGTGKYEWTGFLEPKHHPQVIDPKSGVLVNWNNKPARKFGASDSNWSYGSIQRNNMLENAVQRRGEHDLASVVAAMNRAATQDLRATRTLASIAAVLDTGPAPSPRAQQMLTLLKSWRAAGASRLDRELDGLIDDPGAAIMDQAWPKVADAVMEPVLGPQLGQLASLMGRDNRPSPTGSAYQSGWYGYVDKDLRTLLSRPVAGRFATRFCGKGDLAECRESLWTALDTAGAELAAAQGPDPAQWRSSATAERLSFAPGLLPNTMRWTNRPTFQQAISFDSHR